MAHDSVKRKTWLKQKIQNFIFKKFRGIRVISPDEKGFLISEGVSEEKISIIPIPIDVNTFRYINNKERSGIVFLGNVTPDKDIKTILNALFFVKKNYPNIKMDIIGEIRDDNFYNLLNKYELKENVFIRGFVPHKDLAHILNNYKIYVNSSISEGQCLAAYEAVSCGTALCLPETLSFKSVFSKKALFHKIGDPETLAKNIISYLKNENLRQTHVKLCQQMIKKYYNPETLNKKLKNLFAINNLTESKKRERILVVAPEIHYPLIEGIQKSAWDVIKAANIKGFYPIVLTQYSYGKPFPEVLNNKFLTEYVFRNYRAKALKFLNWFFVGLKTLILIRKEQIKKCLFFSLDYPFIFSFFFSIISGAEIRLFIFSLREINGVRRMFLKLLKRRIKIIVQTEYVKNEILNIGFKNKQVFVAPFMPNKLQYEKIEDDIKRASNLFIYMSNATKEAGIYDIIECARKVSNLEFVLAIRKFTEKEENDFYQLISFIEKNKIKNIKIKRNIKTPKLLLERATAIIIPPKNQLVSMSFPILIMEAFLTKTPVIASDLPIFSFLKDEGLITTYKTLNELIEILTQFDEKNYSYKIEKSFKWAKQLISAEEVFNKYVI
jgi:glycosyltransferase involved in cell wall biosynthesis